MRSRRTHSESRRSRSASGRSRAARRARGASKIVNRSAGDASGSVGCAARLAREERHVELVGWRLRRRRRTAARQQSFDSSAAVRSTTTGCSPCRRPSRVADSSDDGGGAARRVEQHVAGMAERRDVERAGRSEPAHELCGRYARVPCHVHGTEQRDVSRHDRLDYCRGRSGVKTVSRGNRHDRALDCSGRADRHRRAGHDVAHLAGRTVDLSWARCSRLGPRTSSTWATSR